MAKDTISDSANLCFRAISRKFKVALFLSMAFVVFEFYLWTIDSSDMTTMNLVFFIYGGQNDSKQLMPGLKFRHPPHEIIPTTSQWHKVTFHEILMRHRVRTLASCNNTCTGLDGPVCGLTTLEEFTSATKNATVDYMRLFEEGEYIYDFEKDYLQHPPMDDMRQLPDLNESTITFNGRQVENVICATGDVLIGKLALVDGFGQRRSYGGDTVRAWMEGGKNGPYKISGNVTDNMDGSYTLSLRCLFPGSFQLLVTVPKPREFIRLAIVQSVRGISRYMAGKFINGTIEEVTICHTTPNIPGRPCICNMTEFNHRSFYCGRPIHPRLGCEHFAQTQPLFLVKQKYVTDAEYKLIDNTPGDARKFLIRRNVTITVSMKDTLPQLRPCSEFDFNTTWKFNSRPRGFLDRSLTWGSLVCNTSISFKKAAECMKNANVWIFGDSNAIRIYKFFIAHVQAVTLKMNALWPSPIVGKNRRLNITITFIPHEYPFYHKMLWREKYDYGGVAEVINSLPSEGRQVVIFHYFLHVLATHTSALEERISATADAIRRLLERNPDVLVGIRGPHLLHKEWNYNHAIGGDALSSHTIEIFERLFLDMKSRVIFLDGLEISELHENQKLHPSDNVPMDMVTTFLSYACK